MHPIPIWRCLTRLYLYSETLHLSGFADVVEEQAGMLIPVEYKHGQQGEWLNDQVQLCANDTTALKLIQK